MKFKKMLVSVDTKNKSRSSFQTANHYEKIENIGLKLEKELTSPRLIELSGKVTKHSLHEKFLKLSESHAEQRLRAQQRLILKGGKMVNSLTSLSKSLKNGSLLGKLVSIASAQLFLDSTLTPGTKFLPKELILKGQTEIAI